MPKHSGGVKRITPENKCSKSTGAPGWQGNNTGRGSQAPVTGTKSHAEGTHESCCGNSGKRGY